MTTSELIKALKAKYNGEGEKGTKIVTVKEADKKNGGYLVSSFNYGCNWTTETTETYFRTLNELFYVFPILTINDLKKELGLSNTDIAEFFDLTLAAFANSSAKKRYENALCRFYEYIKEKK
jgi:hypothetical protein